MSKLGLNFSTFTIAPNKEHIKGTIIKDTNFFVVKTTEDATWVRLLTDNPEDFIEGEDYLKPKQRR